MTVVCVCGSNQKRGTKKLILSITFFVPLYQNDSQYNMRARSDPYSTASSSNVFSSQADITSSNSVFKASYFFNVSADLASSV